MRVILTHFIIAAGVFASLQPADNVKDTPPAFATVRASDSFANAVLTTYQRYESGLSTHCAKVEITAKQPPVVLAKFKLNGKGEILDASWKESADGTACGEQRRYNALVVISDGKPTVVPQLPGGSAASPTLQHDGLIYAVSAIPKKQAAGAACQPDVLDTAITGAPPTRQPGGLLSSWDEQWSIRSCDQTYLVLMHFIPDSTGTTIRTSPGETKTRK
jgi:hypothetical protein